MSRSQLVATLKQFDAEDRAVSYLAKLPKAVGKMMAVKTALALNYAWEVEEQRMIQRNNPRKVYRSSNDERCWLNRISAKYSHLPSWYSCPTLPLYNLLNHLPPDVSAYVAYNVARYWCLGEELT
jgi:hypothetical protein